jgi:RHS repeat-associated protein
MATVRYTTVGGEVIAEKRGGVRRQYVPDPLGSTVALLDNAQAKTDTFQYWPYGEEAARTGTTPTPLRFVGTLGYYRDSANRAYVRARHLDTRAGRWTSEDPIGFGGGDWNLYGYIDGNPLFLSDPSGLQPASRFTIDPTDIRDCLRKHKPFRPKRPKAPIPSVELTMCVFWQETSFGDQASGLPPGGIGSCTKAAFDQLRKLGDARLAKFKDYRDFVANASECEKALCAFDYLSYAGLDRYGPGKGRTGSYAGPLGGRVRKCEECLKKPLELGLCLIDVPDLLKENLDHYYYGCFSLVHK